MANDLTAAQEVSAEPAPPAFPAPDPARRPARLALYLGGTLLIAGAIALYLGYNGAATNSLPQAQTPYLISGGLVGVALTAVGGITVAMYVLLTVQADFRGELHALRESMERLSEAVSHQAFGNTNGSASAGGTVMVARSSSSYHRADCRLVERTEHARPMPRTEADREGLLPCRICKP